jgi:altronate hydrolase
MEATQKPQAVLLRPDDNVAVAVSALAKSQAVSLGNGTDLKITDFVRPGHKFATCDLAEGEAVRKYGQTIGFASKAISCGEWVHVHNCSADLFDRDYEYATDIPDHPTTNETHTFKGYPRADGRAGTRNYVAIVSTVNCSASTSKLIADNFPKDELAKYENVDGLLPITHKTGCGMQFDGGDHKQLSRVLAGFAQHPNVGAYLIVGLGCEVAQSSHLVESQKLVTVDGLGDSSNGGGSNGHKPVMINIQDAGGVKKTVEAGIEAIRRMLPQVNDVERVDVPASKLVLGMECGGSDGNSGITANPAVGVASDLIVAQGGTSILGETPEIYGAEHLFTRRAVNRAVGEKLIERIRWWEWYTSIFNAEINNNPSPGNKEGGLTTIYEKSLGAVAKGGAAPLASVLEYAEPATTPGLAIMDTPGYDATSLTGIVAGGANVCVFTTGRGSVYGCKPSPCLKIATNSILYERMTDDMDINAGRILEGASLEEIGREIFDELLAVASGKPTKSEAQGLGEEEFSPWIIGPVL